MNLTPSVGSGAHGTTRELTGYTPISTGTSTR